MAVSRPSSLTFAPIGNTKPLDSYEGLRFGEANTELAHRDLGAVLLEVRSMVGTHTGPAEFGTYLLQHHALFDRFTGLPGPALLLDRLEMALAHSKRVQRQVGVLFFSDVDAFGGHSPQLQALARRFRSELRPDDTVARVFDRSFVVVCNDLDRGDDVASIAQRLIVHASVMCRLGIALGCPPEQAQDLLARAAREARVELPAVRLDLRALESADGVE